MPASELPDLSKYTFEQGPIRPPSEAFSLLFRVTRNCPWNKCQFCDVYKTQKFELRPADDVIKDIQSAKAIYDSINEIAVKTNNSARLREIAAAVYQQYQDNYAVRNVALWIWAGRKSVFLQDANSLIMRTPDLIKVLKFLRETFPEIDRVTSYARSKTAAQKSVEELKEIKEAGLTRLHIGMETGSDIVLAYIDKGITSEEHIKGGKHIKEAGMELSEYIMPGIGGRKYSDDHAVNTARVLNEIDPDFIRLRTLCVHPNLLLWSKVQSGEYEIPNDDEVAAEIGTMIEKLEVTSYFASDHIMNLLPELEGQFPESKSRLLHIVNTYMALPREERLNFQLGRRMGYYENLGDLKNMEKRNVIDATIASIEREKAGSLEDVIMKVRGDLSRVN